MRIEFMLLVELMEHGKPPKFKPIINLNHSLIYLFSKTEIWLLDENDDITNVQIGDPMLENFAYYPELFTVDSDFCVQN